MHDGAGKSRDYTVFIDTFLKSIFPSLKMSAYQLKVIIEGKLSPLQMEGKAHQLKVFYQDLNYTDFPCISSGLRLLTAAWRDTALLSHMSLTPCLDFATHTLPDNLFLLTLQTLTLFFKKSALGQEENSSQLYPKWSKTLMSLRLFEALERHESIINLSVTCKVWFLAAY